MPAQSRKRKSDVIEDTPQPATPTGSPSRKKLKVTAAQRQILIDNLQLEITERARKLRAQYAVQCADLRARVERRVNRIPTAVRKMTMGELMAKHAKPAPKTQTKSAMAAARDRPLPPLPKEQSSKTASPMRLKSSPAKGKKRKSSQIHIARDNDDDVFVPDTLPVAKKTRTQAAQNAPPRATSRAGKPANVLSPRSHNSRTLPQSPIKSYSPVKSAFSRPVSPLKPASPLKAAASAATSAISASMHGMIESTKRGTAAAAGKLSRTASREKSPVKPTVASISNTRGNMGPPPRPGALSSPQRSASQTSTQTSTSESSAVSSGTTIVKPKRGTRAAAAKTAPAPKAKATRAAATGATKQTASSAAKGKATAAAPKATARGAAKKVVVAEPAAGRRVLRKRGD
jgi:hypothetical protein